MCFSVSLAPGVGSFGARGTDAPGALWCLFGPFGRKGAPLGLCQETESPEEGSPQQAQSQASQMRGIQWNSISSIWEFLLDIRNSSCCSHLFAMVFWCVNMFSQDKTNTVDWNMRRKSILIKLLSKPAVFLRFPLWHVRILPSCSTSRLPLAAGTTGWFSMEEKYLCSFSPRTPDSSRM